MAVYWTSEVIPIAATALLPVVIFPWIGIMDSRDVCKNYLTVSQYISRLLYSFIHHDYQDGLV